MTRSRVTFPLLLLALPSCIRYQPEPLNPATRPAEYRARRLDDPVIRSYLEQRTASAPGDEWTDVQLALVALLFRPELASARSAWQAARAGLTTAAARPAAGAQGDVERAVSGTGGASPWVVSLAGLFALELGGKRGARLLRARAAAAVSESELRGAAWGIIQEVRLASAAAQQSEESARQLTAELAVLQEVRDLEQQRFAEAALTRTELARTTAEVQSARAALAGAERRQIRARADLALAIGFPPRALVSLSARSPRPLGCGVLQSLASDSLERLALGQRPEIARALAEYAVGEADLRVEISRQYPNLELGPGFIWDQGVNRWTLALALPGVLGRSNRGPIREAGARRAVLASRFHEIQETVLGQVGAAAEGCRGATLERSAADSELTAAEHSVSLARAAYGRGETGRTELARAELALQRARRTQRETQAGEILAGLELEAAAGEWHTDSTVRWPDPRDPLTGARQ
jgi:cobalt-zinc-cadmium efflux system outer membrane protein